MGLMLPRSCRRREDLARDRLGVWTGRACADAWPMHTEAIDYRYDGQALRGYLAADEALAGRVPGVLVVHHAGGLGDEIQEKTRRLASLGYCAFALDLFGKGEPVTDACGASERPRQTWSVGVVSRRPALTR